MTSNTATLNATELSSTQDDMTFSTSASDLELLKDNLKPCEYEPEPSPSPSVITKKPRKVLDLTHVLVKRPTPQINTKRIETLQEWEGVVMDINEDTFAAKLLDITQKDDIEQEFVTLPVDDLSNDDKKLLKPGAIFRWVVGYEVGKALNRKRMSQITFRRLPAWTKKDLDAAKTKAKQLGMASQSAK